MTCQLDVNWNGYLRDLPPELTDSIRGYVTHYSRTFREENRIQQTRSLLSALSGFFHSENLTCTGEVTPRIWFRHIETRIRAGVNPSSLNTTLRIIQSFLRYLKGNGIPICESMLEVRPLKIGQPLPRDLTASQVKVLLQVVSSPIDRAWIILMLHCGLRTCEVRSLHWSDVDLHAQTIRIHESKGLQSRMVFLSPQVIQEFNRLPRNSDSVDEKFGLMIYRNNLCKDTREWMIDFINTLGNELAVTL
jgi:integrase